MNRKTGIILGLIVALLVMTLCAAAGWSHAHAQIPVDDCKPVSWDKTKLTITWQGAPSGGMDYYAVYYLTDETGYQFLTTTDAWGWTPTDVILAANADFSGHRWVMSGLYCVAHFSDGSSAWSQPNPFAYVGDFVQRIIGSVLTRVQK